MNGADMRSELIKNIEQSDEDIYFWIRNDDVYEYSDNFKKILFLYKKYEIDVIYAVIPTILEENLIPNLYKATISQHGFSHKNYSSNGKCELSDERDQKEVLFEILKGKSKLENLFNKKITILTPPYNKIDSEIEKILKEHYVYLSTFGTNKSLFKKDINPYVDIINWKIKKFGGKNFCDIQIIRAMEKTNNIGICVHHDLIEKEGYDYLDNLFYDLKNIKKVKLRRKKI